MEEEEDAPVLVIDAGTSKWSVGFAGDDTPLEGCGGMTCRFFQQRLRFAIGETACGRTCAVGCALSANLPAH